MTSPWLPHRLNPDPTNPYDDEHYNPDRPRISWEPEDYHQEPIPDVRWPRGQKPTNLWRGLHIDLDHPQWADHPNVQGMKRILYGEQDTGGGLYAPSPSQGNLHPHPASPEGKALSQHILDFAEDVGQNVDTYREPWTEENDATRVPFTKIHDKSDPTWLGRHWTTDPDVADSYAYKTTPGRRGLSVLMRARWDGRGEDLSRANVGGSWPDENEINLVPGTQLDIHGLGIRHPDSVHNMYNSQYHNLLKGQDHEQRTAGRLATSYEEWSAADAARKPINLETAAEPFQMRIEHLDPHLVYDREREMSDDPLRGWRKRTVPLVKDVKRNGITMPVTMETDGHLGILDDGNHRAAAAKILGLPTVPVRFRRADTRYLSRGGGVPLHPSVQQHLADHPEALLDHVERQPSWAQGEFPGHTRPYERQAFRLTAALNDEDRVSVAEHIMEENGHVGQQFRVPRATRAEAEPLGLSSRQLQRQHSAEADSYVNDVLNDHGHEGGIRVEPHHWDLRSPGSGRAVTDGFNYIGLAGGHTNELELLHETAHILTQTPHAPGGHGPDFQQAAHALYQKHLGPEAADIFSGLIWPNHHRQAFRLTAAFDREAMAAEDWEVRGQPLTPVDSELPDYWQLGQYSAHSKIDGKKVGELNISSLGTGHPLHIDNLVTHPDVRGEGVARAMLTQMVDHHPGREIDPGQTTQSGEAMRQHLHKQRPDVTVLPGEPEAAWFDPRYHNRWHTAALQFVRHDVHPDADDDAHAVSAYLGHRPVGRLRWYPGDGELHQIEVHPQYRRHGIASAMFDWAQANAEPRLHHSPAMTDEGRRWAASMGYRPQEYTHVPEATGALWRTADIAEGNPRTASYADDIWDIIGRPRDEPPKRPEPPPRPRPDPIEGVAPGYEDDYLRYSQQEDRTHTAHLWMPTEIADHYREDDRDINDPKTQMIEKVIREHGGIRQPLVLSASATHGLLTEGNHRLAVAKKLGIPEVPVRFFYHPTKVHSNGGAHAPVEHHPAVAAWMRRNGTAFPLPEEMERDEGLRGERLSRAFRLTAAFDREAMPAPLPEGLTFHHKPSRYLDESEYSYMEPSLSAHLNGEQVGRIRWHDRDDLRDYAPGEVSGITVAEPHRRSGIATELFDRAKEIEPRLHHSPQRSPLGQQWIDYERSRQAFRLTAAFDREAMPTYYHITDNPDFKPDPQFRPENNGTLGGNFDPGLFVSRDPDHWAQGYGYWRPYMSEIDVPHEVGQKFQNSPEMFIKPEDYDKLTVKRTIPIDAYSREKFNEHGWVESDSGKDFETGEQLPEAPWGGYGGKTPGYKYPGTAMDRPEEWRRNYEKQVRDYQERTPGIIASQAFRLTAAFKVPA